MYAMKITQDAFENMIYDSGMVLNAFNLENPTTPTDEQIVCTTTGDISINVTMETVDMAEDVNCLHGKYLEYQRLTNWQVEASFTALEISANVLKMALGAADVTDNKITPRGQFKRADFVDRYLVFKTLGDKLAVVKLVNSLSTGGVQISTSKDSKGNLSVTLTAFASTENQDAVPVEFYMLEPSEEDTDPDGA